MEAEYDTDSQKRIKLLGRISVYLVVVMLVVGTGWFFLWLIDTINDDVITVEAYFLKAFLPNLVGGFLCFAYGD